MCLYCLLLFSVVIQTNIHEIIALRPMVSIYRNSNYKSNVLGTTFNPQLYEKIAEFLSLVENAYNINKESGQAEVISYEDSKAVTTDYRGNGKKDISTRDVMKTIQRNYDMRKSLSELPSNIIRTYYISNPEDLVRFQRFVNKNRFHSAFPKSSYETSNELSSTDASDKFNRNLKDILTEVKRRSLFRIVNQPGEIKPKWSKDFLKVKSNKNKDSSKVSEVTKFDVSNQYVKNNKQNDPHYVDETKDYNRISKERNSEEVDAWEAITKRYDWKTDNTNGSDSNKENIYIDWVENSETDRDLERTDHNLVQENDWTTKYSKSWQEEGIKSDKSKKYKHIDDNVSVIHNKDFHGTNVLKRDKNTKKKILETKELDNKYSGPHDWDNKEKKVSKKKSHPIKKKKTENWEDNDNSNGIRHESAINKKLYNQDGGYKTNKEINQDRHRHEWDVANKRKRDGRTTRRWKPEAVKINEWDNYYPRIESNAKRQKNFNRNIGSFLRTSIPSVGKKGIYDDM